MAERAVDNRKTGDRNPVGLPKEKYEQDSNCCTSSIYGRYDR